MRLLAFFLLTFLLTWTVWFTAAGLAAPGNTGFFGGRGPAFLLGVFAPALVALALTAHDEGRAGVTHLLARIGHWRVGVRWYAFAIGCFAGIKLAAAVVHRIATGEWPPFGDTSVPLILGGIAVSTWAQAGEELGWRGYALPRLAKHVGLGGASLVLGAVWAAWHLPLFVLPDSGSTGQSFPAYLSQVMALSVVLAFLYWKTGGSLLLVMVMHAAVNNTSDIVPAAIGGAVTPILLRGSLVAWATVALSWVVAAPLLHRMRGADIRTSLTTATSASAGFSSGGAGKRATFGVLLIPILCAAACARASAPPDADGIPSQRIITIGEGISLRAGPVLTALPPDQRYRFVAPESLAMGLDADDASSTEEPGIDQLRTVVRTVMADSVRWVVSADLLEMLRAGGEA